MKKKVLVITGGHPFEEDPFFEIFNSFENVDWFHEKQPKASSLLNPEKCRDVDAIIFYDIPGVELKRNIKNHWWKKMNFARKTKSVSF